MITNADFSNVVEERNLLAAENARLRDAAQAVIERWEAPVWKETEPTAAAIYRLRDVLSNIQSDRMAGATGGIQK